jgi:hypothetical protein
MPYRKRSIIELFCIAQLCNENRYLSLHACKEEMIYEPLGHFRSPVPPVTSVLNQSLMCHIYKRGAYSTKGFVIRHIFHRPNTQ